MRCDLRLPSRSSRLAGLLPMRSAAPRLLDSPVRALVVLVPGLVAPGCASLSRRSFVRAALTGHRGGGAGARRAPRSTRGRSESAEVGLCRSGAGMVEVMDDSAVGDRASPVRGGLADVDGVRVVPVSDLAGEPSPLPMRAVRSAGGVGIVAAALAGCLERWPAREPAPSAVQRFVAALTASRGVESSWRRTVRRFGSASGDLVSLRAGRRRPLGLGTGEPRRLRGLGWAARRGGRRRPSDAGGLHAGCAHRGAGCDRGRADVADGADRRYGRTLRGQTAADPDSGAPDARCRRRGSRPTGSPGEAWSLWARWVRRRRDLRRRPARRRIARTGIAACAEVRCGSMWQQSTAATPASVQGSLSGTDAASQHRTPACGAQRSSKSAARLPARRARATRGARRRAGRR